MLGLGLRAIQGPIVNSSLLLRSPVKQTGFNAEVRLIRVNDLFKMELIADCPGKRPVFLVQEMPWSLSSSTILPQRHFVLSKTLAPVRWAIAIRSSNVLSRFPTLAIGNASDYAAVWLSCAARSQQ